MRDERPAVLPRRVVEAVGRRIRAVDENHALEPEGLRRECAPVTRTLGLAPPHDPHAAAVDPPVQSLARPLADLARVEQRETLAPGGLEDRACERVLHLPAHNAQRDAAGLTGVVLNALNAVTAAI